MTETSADSMSSGAHMALASCPELRQEAQAFVSWYQKSLRKGDAWGRRDMTSGKVAPLSQGQFLGGTEL